MASYGDDLRARSVIAECRPMRAERCSEHLIAFLRRRRRFAAGWRAGGRGRKASGDPTLFSPCGRLRRRRSRLEPSRCLAGWLVVCWFCLSGGGTCSSSRGLNSFSLALLSYRVRADRECLLVERRAWRWEPLDLGTRPTLRRVLLQLSNVEGDIMCDCGGRFL